MRSSVLLAFLFSLLLGGCRPIVAPASLLAAEKAAASALYHAERLDAAALEPEPAAPAPARLQFAVGDELTLEALAERTVEGSDLVFEQQLENGANYERYIASYQSEGHKIYGLLTLPLGEMPAGGHQAIVFVHGYIPPDIYRTTERYIAYVDSLARAGFVVFKIDLRGHASSEGEATGAYFSPGYTVDTLAALKSLQRLDRVNPQRIGVWGHSMAGNITLRAMLVEPAFRAGVIWAGAVYSYDDFTQYAIQDRSYRPDAASSAASQRNSRLLREAYGPPNTRHPFWRAVSLTAHIDWLQTPLQLHHAVDDAVVDIGYARDLAAVLEGAGKPFELHEYASGGHNIQSPAFEEAMRRTIEFYRSHL